MPIVITKSTHHIEAFAMIVDLNSYARMVAADETGLAAQDTRDNLSGAIAAIERHGGQVVAFMGDALLGLLGTAEEVALACFGIAKDVDRTCEYIANAQSDGPGSWDHMPGGPSLKILIEYGSIGVSTIGSEFLGEQVLLAGVPINYAARMGRFGRGNRCLLGPRAAAQFKGLYGLEGPHSVEGKDGEGLLELYRFDLGDIWREGREHGDPDSYWG